MKRRLALLSVSLGLLAACGTPSPAPPAKLVFAVQSTDVEKTTRAWQPLVADLARQLGVDLDLLVANQTDVVRAAGEQRAHVLWLSSSAAIDAATTSRVRTFAVYESVGGARGYKAVLVARKDGPVRTLDDALAPGKWRYASGARTSTSGYLLPQHFLFSPRGTTAEKTFTSVVYAGHLQNMETLWKGGVDLAINNTTDMQQFQRRVPAADGAFTVLWESPLVPNDVLMIDSGLPRALRERIVAALLAYGRTPREQELLKNASNIARFVPADDTIHAPVAALKSAP